MTVGRVEMCEFISEDYAERASNMGRDYKQSYDSYMKRAKNLKSQELFERFSTVKQYPTVIKFKRKEEYVITTSDDDCEDGVCKL